MKVAAVVTATLALAASAQAATRHTLVRKWQISTYKLSWYEGRGHWLLRPRFDTCYQIKWAKPRGRCFKHRENYRWHKHRVDTISDVLWPPIPEDQSPKAAICAVFGAYCEAAYAVAGCETGGTYDPGASNGQYLGVFQMGTRERATYGHGGTIYEQARAAYRYFIASGRNWGPWECKP